MGDFSFEIKKINLYASNEQLKIEIKERRPSHYHPPKFLRYKSNKICIKSTQREIYNSNKRNKERLNIVHS